MLIYFYDLKTKLKDYNRIKRRFYYNLKKSKLSHYPWKTKSVLVVNNAAEGAADSFFLEYKEFVEVYKVRAKSIENVL